MTRFKFPPLTRWTTFHQLFIAPYFSCENRYTQDELEFSRRTK